MNQGAPAGQPPGLITEVQRQYTTVANNSVASAEQFPEEKYTWQPTPDVRTWAQLVAHMTDDANGNCWAIAGLPAAPASVERGTPAPNSRTKADLVAGFHAAIDVCQKAFANLTPATMMESAGGRGNNSKIGQLITITAHANEHYGNMVTYFRLQNMVPPSSQPRAGGPAMGAPRGGGGGMPGRQ
jgi:DinB superfamily